MLSSHAILSEIQTIFRDVLDQPELVLTRASSAESVEDWDSLAHIVILRAVELHFAVKFALSEIGSLQNVGELADTVQAKLAAQ